MLIMKILFYLSNSMVVLSIILIFIFKYADWTYTMLKCSLIAAAIIATLGGVTGLLTYS